MDIFDPIQKFSDSVSYGLMSLTPDTYTGSAVNFFIFDTIKIGLLLILINFLMAITRYYFPMEKVRDILTKRKWYGANYLMAALLGVITPFCSCSSIPLFIGFLSAGIPLGVTFAFLISSPLVNESSLYLFPAVFGLKITLLYNLVGIMISMFGGMIISKLNMDKDVRTEFIKIRQRGEAESKYKNKKVPLLDLIKLWAKDAWDITKKVFPFVILGVFIGSLIHGFVPENLIEKYLTSKSLLVIPLAVLIGAPLYANSVGIIPIIEALISKGVPMGSALSFMTAVVTISIPELLMLSKVMKRKLLFTFFSITTTGIILMGYLFNAIA